MQEFLRPPGRMLSANAPNPERKTGGPKTARFTVIRPSRCPNPSEAMLARRPGREGDRVRALWPGLAEERKNALARLVRLRQHRSAGLLQDLELREVDHLCGHVHVAN